MKDKVKLELEKERICVRKVKILITIHSLLYNRGSEAVLRSIVMICRYWQPNSTIVVATGKEGEIIKNIPFVDYFVPRFDAGGSLRYLLHEAEDADFFLVTGADNYDGMYGNKMMQEINSIVLPKVKGKTILYDCSLNRKNFLQMTKDDIDRFSIITTRESLTYELFKENFNKKKIYYYSDPAFIMPIEKCILPFGFEDGNMIGINISNLILSGHYGASQEMILESYHKLIDDILKNTNLKIILIQHIFNNGFDLEAVSKLYQLYEKEERVLLLQAEHINSLQIKYIISKLRILVTARTHAAIAAYSTGVPVLAISYSIKSVGIAKDIFGEAENFVLPLSQMQTGNELKDLFIKLLQVEDEVRKYLLDVMPSYKAKSLQFGEVLQIE